MQLSFYIITIVLFVLCTPGIIMRLPAHGTKMKIVVVHTFIFAVILHIVYQAFHHYQENFNGAASPYSTGYIVGLCILIIGAALIFAVLAGGSLAGAGAGAYVATH